MLKYETRKKRNDFMFKFTYEDKFSEADSKRIKRIEDDLLDLNKSMVQLETQAEEIINQIQLLDEQDYQQDDNRKIYYNNLKLIILLHKQYQLMHTDLSFFKTTYCKIASEIQAVSKTPLERLYEIIAEIANIAKSAMGISQKYDEENNRKALFYFCSLRKWRTAVDKYYNKKRTFTFNCDEQSSNNGLELSLDCAESKPSENVEECKHEEYAPQFVKKVRDS